MHGLPYLNRWLVLAYLVMILLAVLFPQAAAHQDDCLIGIHVGPVHVHQVCK